jgi:hypothetical protein
MAKTITEKHRMASRANGGSSKGPKTAAGKKNSSRNALKHGLAAEHIVIPGESMDRFDDLLEDILSRRPYAGELELTFLRGLAQDLWRLERARHLSRDTHMLRMRRQESEVEEKWINPTSDLRATISLQYELGPTGDIKNISLYESRIHRHIKQTLQELAMVEELLPQLSLPELAPEQDDPDEPGPHHPSGPHLVPCPAPETVPEECHSLIENTERTNEPEWDSTPVDSGACGPQNFKAKPQSERTPYPDYQLRQTPPEWPQKTMVAAHGGSSQAA